MFDKDPPVVGNDVGDTSSNSGNTFPSTYSPLGRIFRAGVKLHAAITAAGMNKAKHKAIRVGLADKNPLIQAALRMPAVSHHR